MPAGAVLRSLRIHFSRCVQGCSQFLYFLTVCMLLLKKAPQQLSTRWPWYGYASAPTEVQ